MEIWFHAEWSLTMMPIFLSREIAIEYAFKTATVIAKHSGIHDGNLPRRLAAAPEERKNDIPVINCFRRV